MESQVVLVNGEIPNGVSVGPYENGSERVYGENALVQVGGDENGKGNLAEEVLEDLEEYWEDINDRLIVSRMVSDSVIKGIVTAVEQEAAQKIASKELELASVKKACKVGNFEGCFGSSDASVKHEEMMENLHALRNMAREQFKKVRKEIERARGSNYMKKIGSGSELVGLGEILQEKQSDSWMHVDKMLECLRTTVDNFCMKVADILMLSEISIREFQQERDVSAKLEDVVIQSVFRSLQEEFEEKLWEQNARSCETQNMNWLKKFNDVSNLGTQLAAILKSLSTSEPGLVSHGSHDLDHLHLKVFNDHVAPQTMLCGENGIVDVSDNHVPESYDCQQLKHMSKEELVNYFNDIITKLRREHESVVQQKTEEYFRLKREYLKERGSFTNHGKNEEFDVLRKRIPEVISKLEDFLLENERFPALANNAESIGRLKDRVESLLAENRQLRDCLTDKKNEMKCLEAQVYDVTEKLLEHSLAEENMLKLVENQKSAAEDSYIKASLTEEVYRCALRELIEQMRCDSEDSNMELLIHRDIYDIILREAAVPSETIKKYEAEDSDIKSLIMQELTELVFKGAVQDTGRELKDLYQKALTDEEKRNYLETKALEKEHELKLVSDEKEKLKQEILDLGAAMEQKEKLAIELLVSLSNERQQYELAALELRNLREHVDRQQKLISESERECESLRAQSLEACEQIDKLNHKLDQTKEALEEANRERDTTLALAREVHDKLLSSEQREEKLKKEMETVARLFSKFLDDFECGVSGAVRNNSLRLEDMHSHLESLTKMAIVLKKTGLMYKMRLERKCADLQMAEAEVDVLGDEVDALLRLLEKIYIALDHYSPVLKHYPGIIEILELVRRELSGESTKLR